MAHHKEDRSGSNSMDGPVTRSDGYQQRDGGSGRGESRALILPTYYIPCLLGRKGAAVRKIESDFNVSVSIDAKIPVLGADEALCIITGQNDDKIKAAANFIEAKFPKYKAHIHNSGGGGESGPFVMARDYAPVVIGNKGSVVSQIERDYCVDVVIYDKIPDLVGEALCVVTAKVGQGQERTDFRTEDKIKAAIKLIKAKLSEHAANIHKAEAAKNAAAAKIRAKPNLSGTRGDKLHMDGQANSHAKARIDDLPSSRAYYLPLNLAYELPSDRALPSILCQSNMDFPRNTLWYVGLTGRTGRFGASLTSLTRGGRRGGRNLAAVDYRVATANHPINQVAVDHQLSPPPSKPLHSSLAYVRKRTRTTMIKPR